MKRILALAVALPVLAWAQAAPLAEFPAGASIPDAKAIQEHLAGNVFSLRLASGMTVRLEYNRNGYFFFNSSNGAPDKGTWQAQDGKLCSERSRAAQACSDVRLQGSTMLVKLASTGEIVTLEKKP